MRDLALLQPALMNLAEDTPWFIHMAAEPLKQIWKLHPDLNLSALVSPTTNLVQIHKGPLERRRNCYNNDIIINESSSVGNGNADSNINASSSPPGVLIGGIAGGVLGGILLLALVGLFPCIFLRRRRLRLQEQHRQENLNRALKGASALGPHSQRPSGNTSPGMKETGQGGNDMSSGVGAIISIDQNYAPVSPPIPASTGGRSSPYTQSGAWGGGRSNNMIPQSRDSYPTHAAGLTGSQFTPVPNTVPGRSQYY